MSTNALVRNRSDSEDGRRQAVPSSRGINCPAIYNQPPPAKTDKSLEIATNSNINSLCLIALRIKTIRWIVFICAVFILQALILVRVQYFQKACFSALHGLKIQKSLCFQCFYLGMLKSYPRDGRLHFTSIFIKSKLPYSISNSHAKSGSSIL